MKWKSAKQRTANQYRKKKKKTENWFLVNIKKIDRLSARLTRKERAKTLVTKSRNERRNVTINSTEMQSI